MSTYLENIADCAINNEEFVGKPYIFTNNLNLKINNV